jgi:hypothetical protein
MSCITEFNPSRLRRGRLFDDDLEEDPWVIYHGTSVCNGESIEQQGFTYTANQITQVDLERVKFIFNTMRWTGSDQGGFGVLSAFSSTDFSESKTSPVFFAETSCRALLYSTREFAGGEKSRAVRRAIQDLLQYLADDRLRVAHAAELRVNHEYLVSKSAAASEIELNIPPTVDATWLSQQVESVQDLAAIALRTAEEYSGGIIYAVRINDLDLANLSYFGPMGIKSWSSIPPSRIVSKMTIPPDFTYDLTAIVTDFERLRSTLRAEVLSRMSWTPVDPPS